MYRKYITVIVLTIHSCLAAVSTNRRPNELLNPSPLLNTNLLQFESSMGQPVYTPLINKEQEYLTEKAPEEWIVTPNNNVKRYRNSEHINDFYRSIRYPHNERIREHLCMVSQVLDDTDPEIITIKEECHEGNFNIIWKGEERRMACKQHYTTVIFNIKDEPEKVQLRTGCTVRIY
ncbi:uncharacterized protein LOC123294292 [Chrysoperla carnea]|uniref:uncharacterized protein LOC123294292 n=1 Tax=Chrysoperla carnea TaxID=189513 RepID=UPI001D09416E|nr:uncharacterized protein LOC123294292 [Chrysoperla carnea]